MFLSKPELEQLTGKKRPSAQVRWLRDHGYKIEVNGLGHPVVTVAEVNRRLLGGSAARKQEPNWEALYGQAS